MRWLRPLGTLLFVTFLALVGVACGTGGGGGDEDATPAATATPLLPNTSREAQELAEEYKPVLYVPPYTVCDKDLDTDPFLPMAIDKLLGNQDVRLVNRETKEQKLAPVLADIADAGSPLFLDTLRDADPLNQSDVCKYEATYLGYSSQTAVYPRVIEQDGHVIIQYWLFSYFDNWIGNRHEGDWEMVQVVFDADTVAEIDDEDEPEHVDYSQHTGGRRFDWDDVNKDPGNSHHPVVYIGAGSHANYPKAGYWEAKIDIPLGPIHGEFYGCDRADGTRRAAYDLADLLGEPGPAGNQWLSFSGPWGEGIMPGYRGVASLQHQTQGKDPLGWGDGLDDDEPSRCVKQKLGQVTFFKILNFTPSQGLREKITVAVSRTLTVFTRWPGSDVNVTLESPEKDEDGQPIIIDANTEDKDIRHEEGDTYELFQITNAAEGEWTIIVEGTDLAPDEPVVLEVVQSPPTCDSINRNADDEDSDLDGIPNGLESSEDLDPCSWDTDRDGVTDIEEDGAPTREVTATEPIPTNDCGGFGVTLTYEQPDDSTVILSWDPLNGCAPFTGTLTAAYDDQAEPYAKYDIAEGVNEIRDEIPARCDDNRDATYSVSYVLDLSDSIGNVTGDKRTIEVPWICDLR
jgi:hypothetical protein